MKLLARLTALLMAFLLVAQAASAMPGCEAASSPTPAHRHAMPDGMPMDHQQQAPVPAGHHATCELDLCAAMSGCGPTALMAEWPRLAPATATAPGIVAFRATSSPVGPAAPEPPPPRA
ncbi:MAG TPA: hypothetical protein VG692_03545 [Gemmatimonadales bacterium]|nr:hypothetical protein [Gemmatimonadales bacterium]